MLGTKIIFDNIRKTLKFVVEVDAFANVKILL